MDATEPITDEADLIHRRVVVARLAWLEHRLAAAARDADEPTRQQLEALDLVAAAARDRNDARRRALDGAIAPLVELAGTLAFGYERDAFCAHVIRRLTARW